MKQNKLLRYFLIIAILLIILAISGKKAGWFGKEMTVEVAVEKVQRRTITESVTANGKIQPVTEVKISPDVSGEIVELHVKEGDEVDQGFLLARINPDTYISQRDRAAAAVNTAESNLANARARLAQVEAQFVQTRLSFQRSEKLWEQETISEAEWESALASFEVTKAETEAARQSVKSAEFGVKSAMASLRETEEQLRKTSIYAPMSGTVTRLLVEKGERVVGSQLMTGTEMMRISDLSKMEALVEVNENDIIRVKMHDTALIEIDAFLDEEFRGIVTEIANSAKLQGMGTDQVTNFEVKILILHESYTHLVTENGKHPFLPGMSSTSEIMTRTRSNVLSVPIQSITAKNDSVLRKEMDEAYDSLMLDSDENKELVEIAYVVQTDKVLVKEVKTGIQDNMYIEITRGLSEKDNVVVAPYSAITRKLEHETPVEITKRENLFKVED